ncbi:endonuclease domain-containing protein [Paramagnetospirillum kuznetsovii]|uniref:Endonuclease domain-containing protein n=1 Tax=Paramagnetospirillum kuznetsovii TaxID=2053833 RepID=A0A364P3G7_9PROT|nr:endonuclease domain-containing protein [Paramagnetospirillum kuznetsovii]RAU23655.1 endonuclease domain-containing protein [Paramagnetospirillum kuznetsovii]
MKRARTVADTRARWLRANQTDAERALWKCLRELKTVGFHFRRQAPIGPYIADFASHAARLIIEVDGGQHGLEDGVIADTRRTVWLEGQGYRVLRFWNSDVLGNMDGVMRVVRETLGLQA